MKNEIKKSVYALLAAGLFVFSSCQEESLTGTVLSEPEPMTELDLWIDTVFRQTYNIRVQYKWDEADTDHSHDIVPPRIELVQPFLKVVKKLLMLMGLVFFKVK